MNKISLKQLRRAAAFIIAAAMLLSGIPFNNIVNEVKAAPVTEGDWEYEITASDAGSGAHITAYLGNGGAVAIPEKLGGVDVVAITKPIFKENLDIISATIPNCITYISEETFFKCTALKSVSLGNGIKRIENSTFSGTGLEKVTIPDSVISIGTGAFNDTKRLTSVTFGKNVKTLESAAFQLSSLTKLEFPDSLETIGASSFMKCTELSAIEFGKNLKTIEKNAFVWTSKLLELEIPDSVTTLGEEIIGASPIQKVTFGKGIATINTDFFKTTSEIKTLVFRNPDFTFPSDFAAAETALSHLNLVYGYAGSEVEDYAKIRGAAFIPLGKPIVLLLKKDERVVPNITVTDELSRTEVSSKTGLVQFPFSNYDHEKKYNFIITMNGNSYPLELIDAESKIVNFYTIKVNVTKDGVPLAGAQVSIDGYSAPAQTNANGMADLLLLDNAATYQVNVEYKGVTGTIAAQADELKYGNCTVDLSEQSAKNPTISGKIIHHNAGVSGIVLTAEQDGKTWYAKTKVDGSYRFILPHGAVGGYDIKLLETDSYSDGLPEETQKQNILVDSTNIDFNFKDGNVIKGMVKDRAKNVIPDTRIYLEKDSKIWSAVTDDLGNYNFSALPDGNYKMYYGRTGYIYTDDETIAINGDTVVTKDILLTDYSVTTARNITYDISVKSPIEYGEKGVVTVRAQNQDYIDYKNMVLEVNIPNGVIIDPAILNQNQKYDGTRRVLSMSISLNGKGDGYGKDVAVFNFMYQLEDGYSKNKVVFTSFARDEAAVPETGYDAVTPELLWSRSIEDQTINRLSSDPVWKWSELSQLQTPISDPTKVWDGQFDRLLNMYADDSDITTDYATWEMKGRAGNEYRRFRTEFNKPKAAYNYVNILSENQEAYSGGGALLPMNDEVFFFVYPKGTAISDTNANKYLAFWGSTQFEKYPQGKFMGVPGNKGIWYKKTALIPAFRHSDYWVIDGTANRIKEILDANAKAETFVVDVFVGEYANGGGMDKFNLSFTNTKIPSLSSEESTMPYKDFIGLAHADLMRTSLTGEEFVYTSELKSEPYELSGRALKNSAVEIVYLGQEASEPVMEKFDTAGTYTKPAANLPATSGNYAYIAKSTKGGATVYSNVHVVEVIEDQLELTKKLALVSAKIDWRKGYGKNPYIELTKAWVQSGHSLLVGIDISVQFNNQLLKGDQVYYQLSGVKQPLLADDNLQAQAKFDTACTSDVTVVVIRDGQVIFKQLIGKICIIIDPSGYVYDKHTQKRLSGVTVTCYEQDQNGNWILWDAQAHNQQNPLVTDAEGKYGWDVPEGVFKVTASKEGYANYDTIDDILYGYEIAGEKESLIRIPPPRLDINMGMVNIEVPTVTASFPQRSGTMAPADVISFTFNKAMDKDTILNGIRLKKGNDVIAATVSLNRAMDVVTLYPASKLAVGNYTVVFSDNILDFVQKQKLNEAAFNFTVSTAIPAQNLALTVAEEQIQVSDGEGFELNFNHEICLAKAPVSVEEPYGKLVSEAGEEERVSVFLSSDNKSLVIKPERRLKPATKYGLFLYNIEGADGQTLQMNEIAVHTLERAKLPVSNMDGGTIFEGQVITLTTDTLDANIFYTTDGSVPTENSKVYQSPLILTGNTIIKAVAVKDNMAESDVAVYEYTIGAADATPTISGAERMTLKEGYQATETNPYTVTGGIYAQVIKVSGHELIYWNEKNRTLEIAAGLTAGEYPVKLKVSNGMLPDDELTFVLTIEKEVIEIPQAPTITGSDSMTLTEGYEATTSTAYVVSGTGEVAVEKVSGNEKITWNNDDHKLYIAAGLPGGRYPVQLKASNGTEPDADLMFTLTIVPREPEQRLEPPKISGQRIMTLSEGYQTTATSAYIITGSGTVTVAQVKGDKKVTWNEKENNFTIAAGLTRGTYPVQIIASNGTKPDFVLTFTLTVTPGKTKPMVPEVRKVTVAANAANVYKGNSTKVTAKVTGIYNPPVIVKWSVTGQKKSGTGISSSGVLKVAANETATKLNVVATSLVDKTKSARITIRVITPQTVMPGVKEIALSKKVKRGQKIALRAPKATTLYYTTNGKNPTLKSKKVKPGKMFKIAIRKRTKVKVFAIKSNCLKSKIVTRSYTVK